MGFVIIIITMVTIVTFKVALRQKAMEINRLVGKTHEIMHESVSLKSAYQYIVLHERGYLLTGNEDEIQQIERYSKLFEQHFDKLYSLVEDYEIEQAILANLMKSFEEMQTNVITPMLNMRALIETAPTDFVQGTQFTEKFSMTEAFITEQIAILETIELRADQQLERQRQSLNRWYAYDNVLTVAGPVIILSVIFFIGLLAVLKVTAYRREQDAYQKQLKDARDRYSNAIEGANVGTWEWHVQDQSTSFNEKWAEMLGYTLEELQPVSLDTWTDRIHPEDAGLAFQEIEKVFSGEKQAYSFDVRMRRKDGSWLWIHDQGKVISWDGEGKPLLMTGTHTDINERKVAQFALEESEKASNLLIDSMIQGLAHYEAIPDEEGNTYDVRFLKTNPSFDQLLGVHKGYLIGKTLREIMPDVNESWIGMHDKVATTGKPASYEAYSKVLDKYFLTSIYSPKPHEFAVIMDDITERKELELQVFLEKELFETTLLSVGDGVISTDAEATVLFMNRIAEELTGWRAEEAKGRPFTEIFKIVSGEERKKCQDPVSRVLQEGKAVTLFNDTILIARDGVERYIDDSASPIMDKEKRIRGVVLVFRDSTETKKEQDKILQLSYRDPLTGLYNRRYYDKIKETVDSEPYYPLTLVLGDVNGLKLTNDAFGHDAGDQLLKKVAAVFRKTCREGDIITRFGGDEFILLLPKTDVTHAGIIVDRLNKALLKEEIRGLSVSVSFGYAVKEKDPMTFEETFKRAEDGMYSEKLTKSSAFKKHAIDTLLVKQFELNQWEKEHSLKVGQLSKLFAQEMGFSKDEVWQIERGASLHDLGKIAIDETILCQRETLTQAQWLELKRHPEIGYTILRSVGEYAPFAEYVLYHHERWDGTGYPQKLKGEEIPLPARMIAIVDSYVAMTSNRAYKQALTHEGAVEQLHACKGTQFDPDLVPIFVEKVLPSYLEANRQGQDTATTNPITL